jgi:DNA polymerase III subunit epsilon
MLLLALDFETLGLSPETDRVIEIGAALWSTKLKTPVKLFSEFVHDETYAPVPEEITRLTGINQEMLTNWGYHPKEAFLFLTALMNKAAYIVAHNGNEFDRKFYEAECRRLEITPSDRPWLDTTLDVPYPDEIYTRKLSYLASEYGFINPFPHRALCDVFTMLTVMSKFDIENIIAYSKEPLVTLQALCLPPWEDGGASSAKAKELYFKWISDKKVWERKIKQSKAPGILAQAKDKGLTVKIG